MNLALLVVRALNLAFLLAAAKLAAQGSTAGIAVPVAAAAATLVAEAALILTRRPADPRLRGHLAAAFCVGDLVLTLWTVHWTGAWGRGPELASLVPACLLAVSHGALAGAAAGAIPMALSSFVLLSGVLGPPAEPGMGALLALRVAALALAPLAVGVAMTPARGESAARAREILSRLRAAQIGEYLSFALFQLRDYAITISSVAEALALAAPTEDAKQNERVERLRRSATELNAKLSRVLGDKSALTTARPQSNAPTDLLALARACVDEAREAFSPGSVEVSVVAEGPAPAARTDRRSVELALMAVLQNSLDACRLRGSGAVTVFLRVAGGYGEIEVADDGGGIPEDAKATIFEPFISARGTGHGLGLGLSMARRFLERVGGELRLKSKGGYTAALLRVPLERELPKIRLEESTWAGRRGESRPEGA